MGVLWALIKKELIVTLRDRRMRFILFGAPVIQLIIFGYVVTTDIKNIPFSVFDYNKTNFSRGLTSSFLSSGYFIKTSNPVISDKTPFEVLEKKEAKVVLIIPPDFNKNLVRNLPAEIQFLIDGSDANSARIINGYIQEIVKEYSSKTLNLTKNSANFHKGNRILLQNGVLTGTLYPKIRIWFNPELKSSNYMVPGILSLILFIITSVLTSMAITKEKEMGTIEQILVSPLKRWEFILGKTIPFVLIGFIEILLILGVARFLFSIPIKGNLFLLLGVSIIFLFTTLGIGILASTVSKTQSQVMLTIFPVLMPAFLLSGLFFPIDSIPLALRWFAYINPLTYFLIIVRSILLKGTGIIELYREIIILLLFGIFFILASSYAFRKRIE